MPPDSRPLSDMPPLVERACGECRAGWLGEAGEPCPYCRATYERLIVDQRRALLEPPWLHSDAGNPRDDELSDDDKAVWDHTRGQSRGADSVAMWVTRLARAIQTGLITHTEAERAVRKATR